MRRLLILAGEESGMIYARRIAERVRELYPGCEVRGYSDYGFSTADLAVIGFFAVFRRIFFFMRVKRTMMRAIDEWKPDAVCTVDYPGMNLRLAAHAKKAGVRAVHVVCPQVWAWHQGRIPKIERSLDHLCCFFPFEPAIFSPGFAEFVGHPLKEMVSHTSHLQPPTSNLPHPSLVAMLPGSRVGEVDRILPSLLGAAARLRQRGNVRFAIPAANAKVRRRIDALVAKSGLEVAVSDGGAREVLSRATCAVVASGTATLEAALCGCPTLLVYRVGVVTAMIARLVIRGVRHLGLANIIAEKAGMESPMPELLQGDFTVGRTVERLSEWLDDPEARARNAEALAKAMALLDGGGDAVGKIVRAIAGSEGGK